MTERRWPVKIYITWEHFGDSAPGRSFSASDRVYPDYPGFIRADIVERMAEALEILLDEADGFSVSGVYFNEPCMGHKGPDLARSALSAFKNSAQ